MLAIEWAGFIGGYLVDWLIEMEIRLQFLII